MTFTPGEAIRDHELALAVYWESLAYAPYLAAAACHWEGDSLVGAPGDEGKPIYQRAVERVGPGRARALLEDVQGAHRHVAAVTARIERRRAADEASRVA
jgi:hypothetical protein